MPDPADVLAGGPAQPVLRTGTVQASPPPTAKICWVRFGPDEDPLDLPYLAGYVPVAGDEVSALFAARGTMQGIVLGGRQSQSGNMVINGNFYRAPILVFPPVNAPPYHWFRYVASGTGALFCQVFKPSLMRFIGNVNQPSSPANSDTTIYSSAIPVRAGAAYSITTAGHASLFINSALTVQSRVAWFAEAAADYPNFISETQFGADTLAANSETDIYHFTNATTAPAGAAYARVVMRHNHTSSGASSGGNMQWAEAVMLPV